RGRNDRLEAALSQSPMADLASTGTANGPAFSDAERRKVVIQHELLAVLFNKAVDALFITNGTECRRDHGLGFAACENSGAVRSWQHSDLARDRPELIHGSAIDSLAFQNQVADHALLEAFECCGDLLRRVIARPVLRDEFIENSLP